MNIRIIVVFCFVGLSYGQLSGNSSNIPGNSSNILGNSSNSSAFSELPRFNDNVGQNVSAFGISEERPREERPPGRRPGGLDGRRPNGEGGRRLDRQDGRRPGGFLAPEQPRVVRQEPVLVTGADLLAFLALSNAPLIPSDPTPAWPTQGNLRQTLPQGGQRLPPPPQPLGDQRQPPPQGDQRQPPPQTGGQRYSPPQGDRRQPAPGGLRLPPPPPRR